MCVCVPLPSPLYEPVLRQQRSVGIPPSLNPTPCMYIGMTHTYIKARERVSVQNVQNVGSTFLGVGLRCFSLSLMLLFNGSKDLSVLLPS